MQTKLYVGNLSDLVTVDGLRRRFGQCGTVADVHLAVDRTSGRLRGYAFVTMASVADAQSAKSQLNGVIFEERPLRVSDAGEDRENHSRSKDTEKPRVKITSQFRERHNMAYELDCSGVELMIKVFPTEDDEMWRMEATSKNTVGAADAVVTGTAPTRALALKDLGQSWQERAMASGLRAIDWPAVADAMAAVRAI